MDNTQERLHPWRQLNRQVFRFSDSFLFYKDRVQVQTHNEIDYFYLERPISATVVAKTKNSEIVMIRQYRYPVNDWCWELPAGAFIPGVDKDLKEAANRELQEETGAVCPQLEDIGSFYVASHLSNEITHVFVGVDAVIGENQPEMSEVLEVKLVPISEALGMAKRGEISDGPSALALLLAERRL